MPPVARKKSTPAPEPTPTPKPADDSMEMRFVTLKATRTWAAWLARLAKHERTTVAGLIDRLTLELAERKGFEPPPQRTP
jgi:hypothetical protein